MLRDGGVTKDAGRQHMYIDSAAILDCCITVRLDVYTNMVLYGLSVLRQTDRAKLSE